MSNILIFSHAGGSPYHGPNMRWYYLGLALKRAGHEVTIVSSSNFHKYKAPPTLKKSLREDYIDGVRYFWIKTRPYKGRVGQIVNQLQYSYLAHRKADFIYNKVNPDIVIASSPHPFVIYPAARLSYKKKLPLIYEVRDLWPLVVQELGKLSSYNPYIALLKLTEKFAIKKSDMVCSVKPGDIEYFKEKYELPDNRFAYLPNGFFVDENLKKSSASICKEKTKFIVGYVGALSAYYRLEELIGAAKILQSDKEISFKIVGGGEDFEKLSQLTKELKLSNVEFTGQIPKSEVLKYLNEFSVGFVGLKDVSANQYGISCNKLFEYMYASKPIIASYNSEYDPVAYAGCGITIKSGSTEELAMAIKSLKSNPIMCEDMGARGKKYFSKKHDFSVVASKYLKVIRRLVSNYENK